MVIVNHNDSLNAIECVNSVLQSTYRNFRLLVVDNGSSETGFAPLAEVLDEVPVVRTGANLGIGGGYNFGIRRALAMIPDYVLCLHSDMTVAREAIEEMVRVAQARPGAGVVCGRAFNHYTGEPDRFSIIMDPVKGTHVRGVPLPEDREVELDIHDPFCLVRSEVFLTVLLEERYFIGGEELDWGERVKRAGWKFVYTPNAKILHKVSQTTSRIKNPPLTFYLLGRNYFMLCLKNIPRRNLGRCAPYLGWSFCHSLAISVAASVRLRRNLWVWDLLGAADGIVMGSNLLGNYSGRAFLLASRIR